MPCMLLTLTLNPLHDHVTKHHLCCLLPHKLSHSCFSFYVCLHLEERKKDVINVIITLVDKMAPLRLRSSLFPAELQTACCVHRYPASFAQHRQRLLASGLRLRMYQFGDVEWDRPGSGNSLHFCFIIMSRSEGVFLGFWEDDVLDIYNVFLCVYI